MKNIVMSIAMFIMLIAGIGLMAAGFRGVVAYSSSPGLELLSFFTGILCLIAGITTGVYLFGQKSEA